jgi:DNA-binding NarL/FixJ family response regulator
MPPHSSENHSIALAVDDNPEALGMVSSALEENGITVMVARSGPIALDLANRVQPDVVLMDAIMPGMDGFETCRRLKSGNQMISAPVIFMTGLTEPEHIVKGLQCGGVDYITKPVIIDELLARITIHVLNAKLIASAREALDASGRSIIAVDKTGALIWGSPKALATIGEQDVGALSLPGLSDDDLQFREWLARCITVPASRATLFRRASYVLSYVGTTEAQELLLKLLPSQDVSPPQFLGKTFALTPREGEVLFWLTMGKTNRDIAQILALSSRTVNKHLEQIFQKMGVDNRTSAALLADRVLAEN